MSGQIPIPNLLAAMLRLQTLDDQARALDKEAIRVAKQLSGGADALRAAREHEAADAKALEAEHRARALAELDLKAKELELKRHQEQLKSLSDPAACAAKEREIASAQAAVAQLEDKVLGLMDAEEKDQANLKEEKQALSASESEAQAQASQLERERAAYLEQAAVLRQGRPPLLAELGEEHAALYERFFKARGGRVIGPMQGELCWSCAVKVAPALASAVRRGADLNYCQQCGAILAPPQT